MRRWLESVGCVAVDGETIQILVHSKSVTHPAPRYPAESYDTQIMDLPSTAMNLELRTDKQARKIVVLACC